MVDKYAVRNPIFDGTNYAFWSIKMKAYLALGYDVWQSVVDGYTPSSTPPTDTTGKRKSENNAKAEHALLCSLADSEFTKVMHCKSAKEIWNKLKGIYEGNEKVREAKLQSLRMKYESLKMKEDEDIAAYFLRVDEIVNTITTLGEEVEDTLLVWKLLRTLTMKFDPKVSAIEEMKDLKTLTKDELFGILTTYEMRTEDKPSQKEAAFKISKKGKNKNCALKESSSSESDEAEAYFKRKFKKGKGKYKGKFPFKCFNCGKVGHYASKCPQNEEKSEALAKFKAFKELVENEIDAKIKCLRSDRGGEFTSNEFEDFCAEHGIRRQLSATRTPQRNGVVERKNRTIQEMARAMLNESKIADTFWKEAVHTTMYILNKAQIRIDEGRQFEKAMEDHPKEQGEEEESKEESENEEQDNFESPSKTPSKTPLKTPSKTPSKFVQKNHPEGLVIGELDTNI
ncbi:uncharacterized protein LOC131067887 [Cryptomeria japonica]|uniref:uncharacterized protein LOC131067887 n=1 Tax=Cryptomeria japonica TaxID=3369 RepID=UPI0027DA8F91|nr:uncharacterized protein LOC131067887 [Cryptomeria japonica]